MKSHLAPALICLLIGFGTMGCQRDESDALSVVISLPEQDPAGAAKATLQVDYSGTGAKIVTEGNGPACAIILPGISGDFSDDRRGTLTIRTSGPRALRGPADIAACRMKAGSPDAVAADVAHKLVVRVTGAEDTAGKVIDIAAKSAKTHGSSERSESAIQAAQEEAVKAAASAVPPPSAAAIGAAENGEAGGAVHGAGAGTATAGARPGSNAGNGPAAAATALPPPKPSQPSAPKATPVAGAILHNPTASAAANSGGNGNGSGDGAIPASQDRDPSYDDSASDDTSAPAYNLDISVTSPSRFGALQFEIVHLGSSGGFIGRNDSIECTPQVEAIVAGNYAGERVAKIGMISLQGVATPAPIMRCGFRTREPLSPSSFQLQVTDASDTNSETLSPQPTVVISAVSRR